MSQYLASTYESALSRLSSAVPIWNANGEMNGGTMVRSWATDE